MEEQADKLLIHLEGEGRKIADYRKQILDLIQAGDQIDCSQMLLLCNKLNEHISSFDKINEQLINLENAF
ncbi:MAG: hypothetical protein IJ801_04080 [Lachnospiraceae bacterium]|nr:hypothetical protein [Lachnospiraceae bacterium]